jgi:calcineurin-like phosphoesterase family protein
VSEPVEYTSPEPNAALVVGPDDHLVVSLPASTSQRQFQEFLDRLAERLPGRATVICGAEDIAVVRKATGGVVDDPHVIQPAEYRKDPDGG